MAEVLAAALTRPAVALRIGRLKDSTLHARLIGSSRIRVLASPDYLARHGKPRSVEDLSRHALLGFTEPDALNQWPLRDQDDVPLRVQPTVKSGNGETLRQLALAGAGICCLSDFMTGDDRQSGRLVQLFPKQTMDVRQPINAVYYRNTALSSRIKSFVDYLVEQLGELGFDE